MGPKYEIHVWQIDPHLPGRLHRWMPVWEGNSRIRLLLALIPALGARVGRPLRVVYR